MRQSEHQDEAVGARTRFQLLTKSPHRPAESPHSLDERGHSVAVMDIVAIALGVLTFIALLATIKFLDWV
ncbi:MAG TPA: hypothetical protein VGO48_10450 [Conexibacter sp.]|nr:hypothetical protein [Conexibacter sp.]